MQNISIDNWCVHVPTGLLYIARVAYVALASSRVRAALCSTIS